MKPQRILKLRTSLLFSKNLFARLVFTVFWVSILVTQSGCVFSQQPFKTVIRFSTWGSAEELAITQKLIQKFETQHPNIHIDLIAIPENYFQKLHILIAGDLTPDVITVNSFSYPIYAKHGILKPLDKHLTPVLKNSFYPQALHAFKWQGQLMALPRDISNLVIFYNQDLFKKAGLNYPHNSWTQADFLHTALKLTRDTNHDRKVDQWGFSFSGKPPLMWLPFVWSAGGQLLSQDLKQVRLQEPIAVKALQDYADLRHRWHVAPTKEESGNATMSQLFLQGQLGMLLSGRWTVPVLRQQAQFNWDVAPFPSGIAGSKVGIDSSGYAMSAKTKSPKASWLFINFLSSAGAQRQYIQSGLVVPARKDLASSSDFLNGAPRNGEVFTHIIQNGVPTHVPTQWNEFAEELQLALEPVWEGTLTAEEALQKARPKLKAVLQ